MGRVMVEGVGLAFLIDYNITGEHKDKCFGLKDGGGRLREGQEGGNLGI